MVQINFAQKTVNVKIVYYGPGMSGKTTNLEVVHQRAPDANRGDLTSISTDGDRTLFFDYMPLDLGTVAGMRTCFQLYTVPGQVYYNSTRKLVLQGVDGVIFIADSSKSMLEQNLESLRNLEENLNEYGKSLATMPHVIQWNKRDLPDAMDVAELEQHMNRHGAPTFEGVANTGQGVFPTLKGLAAKVLKTIMQEAAGGKAKPATAPGASVPAAPLPSTAPVRPAASVGGAPPAPTRPVPVGAPSSAQPVRAAAAPAPASRLDTVPQTPKVQHQVQQAGGQRHASSGAPMQTSHAPTRPRTRSRQGAPSSVATARRARPTARKEAVAPPAAKKGGLTAGVFVAVAAAAGAVIAWVVLNLL